MTVTFMTQDDVFLPLCFFDACLNSLWGNKSTPGAGNVEL